MAAETQRLMSEGRALMELARLYRSPVFAGRGVPRGDGGVVAVLPGLFGNGAYLQPLRQWLRRIGYRPVRSGLLVNAGCSDRLEGDIERSIARSLAADSRVALIGHSRGGALAWALASRWQDRVSHLALVGSPAPAIVSMLSAGGAFDAGSVASSPVAAAGQWALRRLDPDCTVPHCDCAYLDDIRRPLAAGTQVLSIISRDDPVVPVPASELPKGHNAYVSGSHSGLVYNAEVLRHLAHFLAS